MFSLFWYTEKGIPIRLNYKLKSEVENYLINSTEIHTWSFDGYQSNLLLGFKLTDQRNFEPILVKLPDLLAQNLAQLPSTSMQVDIKASKVSNGEDLLLRQDKHQTRPQGVHMNAIDE